MAGSVSIRRAHFLDRLSAVRAASRGPRSGSDRMTAQALPAPTTRSKPDRKDRVPISCREGRSVAALHSAAAEGTTGMWRQPRLAECDWEEIAGGWSNSVKRGAAGGARRDDGSLPPTPSRRQLRQCGRVSSGKHGRVIESAHCYSLGGQVHVERPAAERLLGAVECVPYEGPCSAAQRTRLGLAPHGVAHNTQPSS